MWRAGLNARRARAWRCASHRECWRLNEAGTSAATKARRKGALDPLVAKYQSRAFKVSGDAVPMEFGSAVKAGCREPGSTRAATSRYASEQISAT